MTDAKTYSNPAIVAANAHAAEADAAVAKAKAPKDPPPSTASDTPAVPPTESSAASATGGTATPPTWWAELETADEKLLRTHPRLSGWLGTEAEKRAEKLAEKRIAAERVEREARDAAAKAVADEAARLKLLADDPYKFRDAELARIAEAKRTAEATRATVGELQNAAVALLEELALPQSDLDELSAKVYPGDAAAGFRAFVREANERAAKHRGGGDADKALAAREKEIRASERAAVLAETNGGEPSPDVSGGRATPTGKLSLKDAANLPQAEYSKLGKTPEERYAAMGLR